MGSWLQTEHFRFLAGLFDQWLFTFSLAQQFLFKEVDNKVDNVSIHLPLVYRKRKLTFVIKGVVMMA